MTMAAPPHDDVRPILRRVGAVLIVVGILDICWMVYCIIHGISYSSSFNIFSVIAGIFLIRGNLRAASLVRRFAVFLLASFIGVVVVWPLIQPVGLTLVEIRLRPASYILSALVGIGILILLWWVIHELGKGPVIAARPQAVGSGINRWLRLPPVAAAALLVTILLAFTHLFLNGADAKHVVQIAHAQLGPGYNYQVSGLNVTTINGRTTVSGVVTAWDNTNIRKLPVRWQK